MEVCRYVVLNPVRARLCARAADWSSSSYRATAGYAPRPPFLSVSWILGHFATSMRRARECYRDFVAQGARQAPWQELRGQIYLGSENFAQTLSDPNEEIGEVPRPQWHPVRRPLAELFHDNEATAVAVAYREEGYRLREIAEHLGLHYSTVSRRLQKLEAGPSTDLTLPASGAAMQDPTP